jgi:ABC-type polysaccharide/polyol phosphate transport system ATPase subunit
MSPAMNETAIRVQSVGIRFFLKQASTSRKEKIISPLRKKKRDFWALKDINFEAQKGEILGIIGANATGKSTLLKIISGIYPATEGSVSVSGTIAPLIELGAAFNPELTGRENIFLSGSIYKIPRKTIQKELDRIIDFAGLRKFIHIPVKNYSSGMFVRLAFSIVIFFRPDIVLIDEVFSVGDESFQQKSFEKILSFRKQGATILLVTHDSKLITQICDRALVLNKGRISFSGEAQEAVDHYHHLLKSGEGFDSDPQLAAPDPEQAGFKRWGNKQVEITAVRFVGDMGENKSIFHPGDYFEAQISYASHLGQESPVFGVAINTIYKLLIYGPNTLLESVPDKFPEKGVVKFIIPSLPLFKGDYLFSASVYDQTLATAFDHHDMMYHFRVESSKAQDFGCVKIQSQWKIDDA